MAFFKAASTAFRQSDVQGSESKASRERDVPANRASAPPNAGEPAYRAIDRLIELGLDPSPKNYAVFYACASNQNPELSDLLDSRIASGEALTNYSVEQIHAEIFGPDGSAQSYRQISSGLKAHVKSVQSLIDQGIAYGADHSREVIGITDGLERVADQQALIACAAEIQTSNRVLVANMRQLHHGLSEAQRKVARLRSELEQVRENANTDHLTGLANRRRMEEFLGHHLTTPDPQSRPLCFVLIDIDNFKTVNDNFGHDAGDNILRHYGALLRRNTKGKDLAARHGGEEFCLVLPNTGLDGAARISEIIRRSFADCSWSSRQNGRDIGSVTASFGVAEHRDGETADQLMKRADLALYRAKDSGRNQVCCSEAG